MLPPLVAGTVILCGVVWRLRGGAFTALTGLNPGTDGARALAAVLIPLMVSYDAGRPELLILALPLFVGLMLSGWGPFQGMGLPAAGVPESSWLRWLPLILRLPKGTFWHDFAGMAQAGAVCMCFTYLFALRLGHHAWALLIAGVMFAPAYALARLNFPAIKNFAAGQSWGEVFAGAAVGAGLLLVFV